MAVLVSVMQCTPSVEAAGRTPCAADASTDARSMPAHQAIDFNRFPYATGAYRHAENTACCWPCAAWAAPKHKTPHPLQQLLLQQHMRSSVVAAQHAGPERFYTKPLFLNIFIDWHDSCYL
ncbi:hypothetical protein [Andreprevotia sp. IGB-42]|uniref:hypothetical protein n=1 Tax=Andreprevotia sp. IGB-42 TaxID=2497473 RepID=UPI001358A7B2|nr:hypothetical protein [Andreprevotia sp. IGB-42]